MGQSAISDRCWFVSIAGFMVSAGSIGGYFRQYRRSPVYQPACHPPGVTWYYFACVCVSGR